MTLYSCTVTHGDVFIVDNESRKTDAHKANVAASGLAQGTTTIGGLLVGAAKGAKAGGTVGGVIGAGVGAVGGFGVGLFFSNMVSDSEIDRYPTLQNGYYREYTVSKIYYSSEVQFYPLGGGAYNVGRWVEVHRWTFAIGCNVYGVVNLLVIPLAEDLYKELSERKSYEKNNTTNLVGHSTRRIFDYAPDIRLLQQFCSKNVSVFRLAMSPPVSRNSL